MRIELLSKPNSLDDALAPVWGVSDSMPRRGSGELLPHPIFMTSTQMRMLIQQQQKPWWKLKPLPGKKDLTFPKPGSQVQFTTRYVRTTDGTLGQSKGRSLSYVSFENIVNAHLVSLGLRMLNEAQGVTEGPDTPLTLAWLELATGGLADRFFEYMWSEGSKYIAYDFEEHYMGREKSGLLLESRLEQIARKAADGAVKTWDPTYAQKRHDRAVKGGQTSKRRREVTLEAIEDLTITEQMKALGRSRSVIMRMRREFQSHT